MVERYRWVLTCVECGRLFDLLDATDAAEWTYGHDCEVDDEADLAGP